MFNGVKAISADPAFSIYVQCGIWIFYPARLIRACLLGLTHKTHKCCAVHTYEIYPFC